MADKTRREFLKAVGAGSATVVIDGCAGRFGKMRENGLDARPNIIFILTDDQRWDAMSCMGHEFLNTPNMDRIAREGTLFTNAFCTTSLCSPSRATFLTGTYAHTHGVINNNGREYDPDITPAYPELLQKAGYRTAHIGKWHQAWHDAPRRGYDYWLSFRGQGVYRNPWFNENGRRFQVKGYTTDLLSDYAVEFIKRNRRGPFCLTLSHKAVHEPFQPPDRHKQLYKDATLKEPASFKDDFSGKAKWQRRWMLKEWGWRLRSSDLRDEQVPESAPPDRWDDPKLWWNENERWRAYYRCIISVDDGIGRIYDALEETGQLENTLIVFASDNGYFLGEHRRHDKRVPYDEAMRIAFLVSFPKAVPAGRTIDELVINTDLAPTVLDYAGVEIPKTVQGVSLRPVLEGKTEKLRDAVLHEYYVDLVHSIPRTLCVRTKEFKYISYPDIDDIDEMYDLRNDPYEMVNLSGDSMYADRKAGLKRELERQLQEVGYRREVPDLTPGVANDAPQGLMLSLAFDKAGDGKVPDLSGNGLDGVALNLNTVEGRQGRAGEFTGDVTVRIEKSQKLDPSKRPWIVEVWVNPHEDGTILSHSDERNGYAMFVDKGVPGIAIKNNMGWAASRTIVDGKRRCRNEWTHLVAVIKEREMLLYVNGELADWLPVPVPLTQLPNGPVLIGCDNKVPVDEELTAKPFKGLVGSVRMYRGRMSAEDVARLMQS